MLVNLGKFPPEVDFFENLLVNLVNFLPEVVLFLPEVGLNQLIFQNFQGFTLVNWQKVWRIWPFFFDEIWFLFEIFKASRGFVTKSLKFSRFF